VLIPVSAHRITLVKPACSLARPNADEHLHLQPPSHARFTPFSGLEKVLGSQEGARQGEGTYIGSSLLLIWRSCSMASTVKSGWRKAALASCRSSALRDMLPPRPSPPPPESLASPVHATGCEIFMPST
jgi:hypothetical protein